LKWRERKKKRDEKDRALEKVFKKLEQDRKSKMWREREKDWKREIKNRDNTDWKRERERLK